MPPGDPDAVKTNFQAGVQEMNEHNFNDSICADQQDPKENLWCHISISKYAENKANTAISSLAHHSDLNRSGRVTLRPAWGRDCGLQGRRGGQTCCSVRPGSAGLIQQHLTLKFK